MRSRLQVKPKARIENIRLRKSSTGTCWSKIFLFQIFATSFGIPGNVLSRPGTRSGRPVLVVIAPCPPLTLVPSQEPLHPDMLTHNFGITDWRSIIATKMHLYQTDKAISLVCGVQSSADLGSAFIHAVNLPRVMIRLGQISHQCAIQQINGPQTTVDSETTDVHIFVIMIPPLHFHSTESWAGC